MLIAASYQRVHGLTLIELLIVITLSVVVIAVGAPAMGQWVRDIEVRTSAALLLSALHATRAEALTRNASVRIDFPDTEGRPGWRMTCVQATARCPATLRQHAVDTGTAVRWGAAKLGTMPSFGTAITAGHEFPASVRFDTSGAVPDISTGDSVARIDVTYHDVTNVRRMVVLVSALGMARICDPAASVGHPQYCH